MNRVDIGIDLGTSSVRIYMRDKGVVVDQPSVVAYEQKTKQITAVGYRAKKMLGKTPETVIVEKPITQGVISNYTLAERLIKSFVMNALQKRKIWGRPNVCVAIPSGISAVEKKAVTDAINRIGAKEVYLIESSIAALIGYNIDILETYGHMVIDIGAGTTDIAVSSAGGIAEGHSEKVAGDNYTAALIKYVRNKYNVELGELTAEDAKTEVGAVVKRKKDLFYEVKGKNIVNGLPERINISSNDTVEAFQDVTKQILDAVYKVIDNAPPELISDIGREGIILTGGSSQLYGMDKLIEEKTGLRVVKAENPTLLVAEGTGKAGEFITVV